MALELHSWGGWLGRWLPSRAGRWDMLHLTLLCTPCLQLSIFYWGVLVPSQTQGIPTSSVDLDQACNKSHPSVTGQWPCHRALSTLGSFTSFISCPPRNAKDWLRYGGKPERDEANPYPPTCPLPARLNSTCHTEKSSSEVTDAAALEAAAQKVLLLTGPAQGAISSGLSALTSDPAPAQQRFPHKCPCCVTAALQVALPSGAILPWHGDTWGATALRTFPLWCRSPQEPSPLCRAHLTWRLLLLPHGMPYFSLVSHSGGFFHFSPSFLPQEQLEAVLTGGGQFMAIHTWVPLAEGTSLTWPVPRSQNLLPPNSQDSVTQKNGLLKADTVIVKFQGSFCLCRLISNEPEEMIGAVGTGG